MTKLLSTIVFLSIASLFLGVIGTNQSFAGIADQGPPLPQSCDECDSIFQQCLDNGTPGQICQDWIDFCNVELMCRSAVGGEMMPIDTTALLVAGTTFTASWMVPIVVSAAGIGLLIQSQKTRFKHNSCPSCHLETDDIFKLGGKKVGKCQNPKCRVSIFFAE